MLAIVPVNTFAYKLMLLLHIVSVVVAFAPGFVIPRVRRKVGAEGAGPSRAVAAAAAAGDAKIHGPALVIAGILGGGLVGMSEKVFTFSQAWVSAAMLVWFLMMGVLFGLLLPAEKKVAAGDDSAVKIAGMAGGILHTLFLVMVILMIWKPGFGS